MSPKKPPKRTGAVLRVRRHMYRDDGTRDHLDRGRCEDCGLGEEHAVHQLEPVPPEVSQAVDRVTGERG